MKKSFLLYFDSLEVLDKMDDKTAGEFLKCLVHYAKTFQELECSPLLELVLIPFYRQLDRDKENYDIICERNRRNGKKGGRKKQTQTNPVKPNETQKTQWHPVKPDKDNDKDTDNDIDTREELFREKVLKFNYPLSMKEAFIDYWTESNTNGKKMRFEMQKTFDISRRLSRWKQNTKELNQESRLPKA